MTDGDDADIKIPQVYKYHTFACYTQRPPGHPRGSCGAAGAQPLWDRLGKALETKGLTEIGFTAAGCLGFCKAGPLMSFIRKESGIVRQRRRISMRSSTLTSCKVNALTADYGVDPQLAPAFTLGLLASRSSVRHSSVEARSRGLNPSSVSRLVLAPIPSKHSTISASPAEEAYIRADAPLSF